MIPLAGALLCSRQLERCHGPSAQRLQSSRDPDDGITPPVVVVCQVDDQLLKTTLRNEETTALLGPHHIEGEEVLDPAGIRDEPVTEGLKAKDDAPASCH